MVQKVTFKKHFKRLLRFVPDYSNWFFKKHGKFLRYCEDVCGFTDLKPFKWYDWHAGFIYYTGYFDAKKIFIKLCVNKYNTINAEMKIAQFNDIKWYPKVFRSEISDFNMIVTEFIETSKRTFTKDEIISVINQACIILYDLRKFGIYHRDIRPENLIVTVENKLYLFDFGWAVYSDDLSFYDSFIEKILNIDYRPNNFEHDDAFSMYKSLLEMFPEEDESIFESVKDLIGKNIIKCN